MASAGKRIKAAREGIERGRLYPVDEAVKMVKDRAKANFDETVELAVNLRSELASQGLDAGPHTICWHLEQRHNISVSPSTIWRRLAEAGLVEANPKKRPRSSYVRFAADLPNEM